MWTVGCSLGTDCWWYWCCWRLLVALVGLLGGFMWFFLWLLCVVCCVLNNRKCATMLNIALGYLLRSNWIDYCCCCCCCCWLVLAKHIRRVWRRNEENVVCRVLAILDRLMFWCVCMCVCVLESFWLWVRVRLPLQSTFSKRNLEIRNWLLV